MIIYCQHSLINTTSVTQYKTEKHKIGMEKLLIKLLNDSKKNKQALILLKTACVKVGNYELASKLRDYERKHFPVTKEAKDAKESAKKLNLLFRMVGLDMDDSACWLVYETLKVFKKRKGNFDIEQAAKIVCKMQDLFEQ